MSQESPENFAVVVAAFAGLFSLLGALAGAALSRKSEHIKWLRQSRSEVFSAFLEKLQSARHQFLLFQVSPEASGLSEAQLEVKLHEIFSEPIRHSRIVRLYLPRKRREEFSSLVQEYWRSSTSKTLGKDRAKVVKILLDEIQDIFESELSS